MLAIILWQFSILIPCVGTSFAKLLKGSNPTISCIFCFGANTAILSIGRKYKILYERNSIAALDIVSSAIGSASSSRSYSGL